MTNNAATTKVLIRDHTLMRACGIGLLLIILEICGRKAYQPLIDVRRTKMKSGRGVVEMRL